MSKMLWSDKEDRFVPWKCEICKAELGNTNWAWEDRIKDDHICLACRKRINADAYWDR